jgi:hypothetical protein
MPSPERVLLSKHTLASPSMPAVIYTSTTADRGSEKVSALAGERETMSGEFIHYNNERGER